MRFYKYQVSSIKSKYQVSKYQIKDEKITTFSLWPIVTGPLAVGSFLVQLILAPPRGVFRVVALRCKWRGFSFRLFNRSVPGDLHF